MEKLKVKSVFVANISLNKNEGIFKKVQAEAEAISKNAGTCCLVVRNEKGSLLIDVNTGQETIQMEGILYTARKLVENGHIETLYIRLMVPGFDLISLMKTARKRGITVYYEIPTCPYYAEQFRSSRKKYRAAAKIVVDRLFSPFIYKYCDHMVIIRSNTSFRMMPKMMEITNGVKAKVIKEKDKSIKDNSVFRMVTVGTLYPYHGYDRILAGLKQCSEMVDGIPVEFHVIGASQTIEELHVMSDKYGLKRVFFHGMKTTNELNEMFDQFDVGLGCLALHRRNADIDTTLKLVEYYCRGIPAVTSGKSPYSDANGTIIVPDNEEPIDVEFIYKQWRSIPGDSIENMSQRAKEQFDWEWIFKDLFQRANQRGREI